MTERYAEARWWVLEEDGEHIRCRLCPRGCRLRDGQTGFCGVRARVGGDAADAELRAPDRLRDRSDREEAALPLPARLADPLVRHARLHARLPLLPELDAQPSRQRRGGDPLGAARGGRRARDRQGDTLDRLHLQRADESSASTSWMSRALARQAGLRNVAVTNGYVTETARARDLRRTRRRECRSESLQRGVLPARRAGPRSSRSSTRSSGSRARRRSGSR